MRRVPAQRALITNIQDSAGWDQKLVCVEAYFLWPQRMDCAIVLMLLLNRFLSHTAVKGVLPVAM